jgi:hypothetical protein
MPGLANRRFYGVLGVYTHRFLWEQVNVRITIKRIVARNKKAGL